MKQIVYYGVQDIRLKEVEVPQPGPGEIVVKNKVTLTCGTDCKMFMRGYRYDPPHLIGHEAAGDIVAIGEGVTRFKLGDRVVAHNTAPCHKCYWCKKGQSSMCVDLPSNLGSYAEYQLIPKNIVEENTFLLPDEMVYKQAALTEPLSCAVYGIDQVDIEQGDSVVVNGCGPIGLMFIRLAYLKGARVIACDSKTNRLELAQKMGARHLIDITKVDQVQAVRDLVEDSRGVDVAIEAAGLPAVWEIAFNQVRAGGQVLCFGGTKSGTKVTFDCTRMHYEQITVKGVFHTTPIHVNAAFELLKMGAISADDFVEHEYTIEETEAAIREHAEGKVIKNCIVYED
ncbi:alcohol dehydrogenase catalytic domain-containing protein [Enterococcus dongliensis]|uniref:alcohol dehydrogenase catalytic domain-containing protein n=1 Tax=Enterococcus dongliensis TaxID=2559925 RepID=UPI00288DEAF5|nr:zinc-binding dehydrogenase [Enterococcus dongliensis]MDT2702976.1 zinc-binding dehydrogenase [Enterococcus dongliensis]